MAAEDHSLLMEALMFFSSGEDHDDTYSTTTSTSSFDSDHDMSTAESTDDDALLDTTLHQVLLGLSDEPFEYGTPTNATRRSPPSRPSISPPAKQPLRRKRAKKCTYAARREEVARLRHCTAQMESQLQHLLKRKRADATATRPQHENELLAQSQAENARLRELVEATAARIRVLQCAGTRVKQI